MSDNSYQQPHYRHEHQGYDSPSYDGRQSMGGPATPPPPPYGVNPNFRPQGGQPYPPQGGQPFSPQGGQGSPPQGGQGYPPQGGQGYPPQGGQVYYVYPSKPQSNIPGLIGFVLSLFSVVLAWIPLYGWALWFVGLVMSVVGIFSKPRALAIVGLIISIVIFAGTVALMVIFLGGLTETEHFVRECTDKFGN